MYDCNISVLLDACLVVVFVSQTATGTECHFVEFFNDAFFMYFFNKHLKHMYSGVFFIIRRECPII